jgi:hypothetical protein
MTDKETVRRHVIPDGVVLMPRRDPTRFPTEPPG